MTSLQQKQFLHIVLNLIAGPAAAAFCARIPHLGINGGAVVSADDDSLGVVYSSYIIELCAETAETTLPASVPDQLFFLSGSVNIIVPFIQEI